ncbi:NAD-dependent epimerase/dehydratase family protein, partial [Candidatus Undinarchaeota archaeon]
HEVTIVDSLIEQVHPEGKKPDYLNPDAEFIKADVTDREKMASLFQDHEIVFHEASAVGVAQSMYQIEHYMDANTRATALLWDLLVNKENSVKKFLVASSMSLYGEGKYECPGCGPVFPQLRPMEQMEKKEWEVKCPNCGKEVKPMPTDEMKPPFTNSIYALGKKDQEEMSIMLGKTYGIPSVALRYFNVYGSRQALSNPYTGVCAIFSSRIKNDNPPMITEDGMQSRDFIHVKDIVRANLMAMDSSKADYEVFNVGSGEPIAIKKIAEILIEKQGKDFSPEITGKFRKGDIRHCYADISKIKQKLDFDLEVSFEDGISELVDWTEDQSGQTAKDDFEQARAELNEKKLLV